MLISPLLLALDRLVPRIDEHVWHEVYDNVPGKQQPVLHVSCLFNRVLRSGNVFFFFLFWCIITILHLLV